MRILHLGDLHFEKDKIEKCLISSEFIVEQAMKYVPDIIVNAGDTFNRVQTLNSKSAVVAAKTFIMDLAEIAPVVIVKGNEAHDSAGCLEVFKNLRTTFPVFVTESVETVYLTESKLISLIEPEKPKAVIHLFSYPEKSWFLRDKPNMSIDESNALINEEITNIMLGFGAVSSGVACPAVLVAHGNVRGSRLSDGQVLVGQDIMIDIRALELASTDVQCWAHIHDTQEVWKNIWYCGSTYHCNWGEKKQKNVLLHDVERGKCNTRLLQIPSRPLSLHECNYIAGLLVDEELLDSTSVLGVPAYDWKDAELRVRVHGTAEELATVTDENVKEKYFGAYSYQIERIAKPENRVRSEEVVQVKSLRDKVTAWGKTIEKEISVETLEHADETERAYLL